MTRLLVVAVLVLLGAVPAAAQEAFPSRTITIVNPYPPGGQADLSGRPFAAALQKVLKQPVVLTNKSGAAGAVGMQSVAVAKPDGYTLLITVPSLHTLPEVDKLFGRAPTFTRDQFAPIARLNADPLVVAVNAERPWKSMKEVLDDAKKRPGEIVFASAGLYGATHVPMEMILNAAGGVKMRHLPTAGGGPATTAVLGGHADLWASTIGPATPHIKSGKIRPLAVTSAKRHEFFPERADAEGARLRRRVLPLDRALRAEGHTDPGRQSAPRRHARGRPGPRVQGRAREALVTGRVSGRRRLQAVARHRRRAPGRRHQEDRKGRGQMMDKGIEAVRAHLAKLPPSDSLRV